MDISYHWRTKLRRELPLRFFVVFVAVHDLLLRAKHLLVAATFPTTGASCGGRRAADFIVLEERAPKPLSLRAFPRVAPIRRRLA
jgi:hypothetical protein